MLRNYLAAALRSMGRNRLYTTINIVGLAVGLAVSMLIFLFIRDELSYEHFIPDYQDVYRLSVVAHLTSGPQVLDTSPPDAAGWLKLDFPTMRAVARLAQSVHSLRHGEVESNEDVFWADPDFFKVFPLPVVAGNLQSALNRPDGIVLTERLARKYFGRDAPIGEQIELDRKHVLTVTAVIRDLPSNTHLKFDAIASGRASFSFLSQLDAMRIPPGYKPWGGMHTYFRLAPGASVADIERQIPAFIDAHMPGYRLTPKHPAGITMPIMPIAAIHLHSHGLSAMKPSGSIQTIYAVTAVGLLILFVAAVNFANLMTARAGQRAVEVGVRKATGAARGHLIAQFVGESLLSVIVAALASLAIVECLMPAYNAFLGRSIAFNYWRDPTLQGALALLVLLVGIAGGCYPAFVLSAFRPTAVLNARSPQRPGSAAVRRLLVVAQFSILIGLIAVTIVIWQQTEFALRQSLRSASDRFLVIFAPCGMNGLSERIKAVPGVRDVACSNQLPLAITPPTQVRARTGSQTTLYYTSIGPGFFELYGFRPLAGRFFSRGRPSDATPTDWSGAPVESIVINETAVRNLSYSSPTAALGQTIEWSHLDATGHGFTPIHRAQIIGVVADFPMNSIRNRIEPAAFFYDPRQLGLINVRLDGYDQPEALAAIDRLCSAIGAVEPVKRIFLNTVINERYRDISREAELFALFALIAVAIAALGLLGLAVFFAEQRTKEIGIRKAMGAETATIVRMLVWQFARPVLWANLLAWPAAFVAMRQWLNGFAYRIPLEPWPFLVAGALALIITLLTVSVQSLTTARAKPVSALRYE
jgi:putative ABC transport system permease protein